MYGSVLDRIGGDHSSEERVRILERRLTRQGTEGQQHPPTGMHDISPSIQLQRHLSVGIHVQGDVRTSDSTAAEQSVPRMSADAEAQLHLWSTKRLKVQGSDELSFPQAKAAPSPFVILSQEDDSTSDIISPPHAPPIPMLEAPGLHAAQTPSSVAAPMLPRTLFHNAGPAPNLSGLEALPQPASHPTRAAAAAATAVGGRATKGVKAISKSGVATSSRAASAPASSIAPSAASTAAAAAAASAAASATAATNAAANAAAAAAAASAARSNPASTPAVNGSTKNAASKRKRRSPAPSARPTLHQMSPEGRLFTQSEEPEVKYDTHLYQHLVHTPASPTQTSRVSGHE